jgi:hypothetical protein
VRKSLVRRPSPALVVAFVALLVALGGTAYAGFSVPKNSVGTKQLKNGAVTTSKIKNGTVTKSKINTSGLTVPNALFANSAGSAGSATNATNATNATHATGADTATNSQQLGGVAAASYLRVGGTLQPGVTEAGDWGVGVNATASEHYYPVATFPVPLPNGVDFNHTIAVSGPSATHCPGAGQADSGYLCVYLGDTLNINAVSDGNIFNPELTGGPGGSGRFGFSIALTATATGSSFGGGSFAVTG